MKKKIFIVTLLAIGCITACSSEKEAHNVNQSEETLINTEIETETADVKETLSEDVSASEINDENGLTSEAKQMIQEIGVTKQGEKLVTCADYEDRVIYNVFAMTDDKNADFYTYVFYRTEDAYKNELANEKHRGEIVEHNDSAKFICTFIENISNKNYNEIFEENTNYGILEVVE